MIRVRVRSRPDRPALQLWYRCQSTRRIITRSAETDNVRAAERAAEAWERELSTHAPIANPSWAHFRDRFEDEFLGLKPKNTQVSYKAALNNWEKVVGVLPRMELITTSLISSFSSKFGRTVGSSETVSQNLRHLRSALRWAEAMEMIRKAPRIIMPKSGRRRLARGKAITLSQFKQIRAAVKHVRPKREIELWQRLLDVLWLSGLRISEAMILSWDEPPITVDLNDGPYPRLVILGEGQKSREDETAVISREFAAWLKKTPKQKREGLVVDLSEFDRSSASHVIRQCASQAGVDATAHDIRRSFGQRLAKVVKPLTLQKMMRHASINTTLSYYVNMEDEDVGSDLWKTKSVQRDVQRLPSVTTRRKNNHNKKAAKHE